MQNQVTVIPADKVISVNGLGLNFNFPAPANMHALQWRGAAGHIEYTDGAPNRLLAAADYAAEVAPFAALWQAEYDRLEAEKNRPLTPEELHAIAAADAAASQPHGFRSVARIGRRTARPDREGPPRTGRPVAFVPRRPSPGRSAAQ